MIKKIFSVLLCAVITAFVFTGCSKKTPESTTNAPLVTQSTTKLVTDTTSFKLSYSKSDSLNPFKSETLNNQVLQNLVFDSLFVIDESYNAQPQIAGSYSYKDKTALIVTIPSGIFFSDGKRLTASSVVYSFNEAKASPRWKNSLKSIASASVESETAVRFNLSYPNPYAHNLLTFAIASSKKDKNGYPIGSGRYIFSEGGGEVFLKVNKKHPDFNPHITKVNLINITAAESIDNAINIGNISYAFRDMSSGAKTKITSSKKPVSTNNLVFLGINEITGITKNEYIRKAIMLAVDRETLIKSAYGGYGKAALSVFNPASSLGKQTSVFSSTADISAAKQAIAQSGYSEKNLTIDILINSDESKFACAKLIKQQLEAAGFKVTINKENSKAYLNKVSNRSFDLYIGETKLSDDMNLKVFFSKKGAASSGINLKGKTAAAYNSYLQGNNEIGKFILEFSDEIPFIPLLYRQGMICYSKSMHGDMQGYANNYFSNIEDWYF